MNDVDTSGFSERPRLDVLPPRTGISSLASPPAGFARVLRAAARSLRRSVHRREPGAGPAPTRVVTGNRVLVAGWFSWAGRGATAGDVHACEVVGRWLSAAKRDYDVASVLPSLPGVDWRSVDPSQYSDVVFVCGPVGQRATPAPLLGRFPMSRHVGIDVTMLEPVGSWNPFEVLIERDSDVAQRPDLSFAVSRRDVPVIGVVLVEPYEPEYGARDMQPAARAAVRRLLDSREAAIVEIDTRLEHNGTGLRTADEVATVFSRVDVVVTTRLHGLVMAIKAGVPALAIDPVAGGAKIRRQAEAIGWPHVRLADELVDADLSSALDACLTEEARELARDCGHRAAEGVERIRARFVELMLLPTRRA
jgi:Polysaccharide pyruvyl transferase